MNVRYTNEHEAEQTNKIDQQLQESFEFFMRIDFKDQQTNKATYDALKQITTSQPSHMVRNQGSYCTHKWVMKSDAQKEMKKLERKQFLAQGIQAEPRICGHNQIFINNANQAKINPRIELTEPSYEWHSN